MNWKDVLTSCMLNLININKSKKKKKKKIMKIGIAFKKEHATKSWYEIKAKLPMLCRLGCERRI